MDEKQASNEGAHRRVGESFHLKFNMPANLTLAGILTLCNKDSIFLREEPAF